MSDIPISSHFFTNRDGNTLMKEFEGILTNNPQVKNLDAVVGFLRASGYFSLRPFLDGINKVRILIGIDVDKYIAKANQKGELFFGAEEEVKEECLRLLKEDIEQSQYTKQVEDGMLQMVQDLIDGKLELRAHPSKKIHAKLYILYPDNYNQHCFGAAITGSSNLSGNGLGIGEEKQYEFNVKLTQFDDVQFAKNEFELLWEEAKNVPINAEDYQSTLDKTYLKGDITPYELYIKMLMEYFSDRVLAIDQEDPFDMPEGKYDYQADAVIEGYQKLIRYDGFFLADVVGLGKTVIATMIAKKFLIENGPEHTKILVVYPPAVEQNWKTTFKDFGIDKYTRFVSNGSLAKVLDEENYDYWNADEYDLVLVDEAHKFRNHTTGAFQQLQEICKMPRVETGYIPGYKKKVMLISATPMNNTPADIYYQILMFQDPRHCTIDGVPNLTAFFSPLVVEFRKFRKQENFDLKEFKKLAEKVRDMLLTDWRNNGNAGAFMFCYRKSESVLRFSYVSEAWTFADDGSFQKESTDAKRFTYLLGEGHRSRTAIQQFEKLRDSSLTLKDLTKAFSVDAVSDMFFDGYKKQYEDIIQYITGKRMVKVSNKWEERQEGKPNTFIMQQFAHFPNPEKAIRDYVKGCSKN